jgi:GNAT superfamily N-acetyltransferase
MLRAATFDDIPQMVHTHCEALPNDLLPKLGRGFLRKVFYPSALRCDDSRAWVCCEREKAIGHVVLSCPSQALTGALRRQPFKVLFALLFACSKRPGTISQILYQFRKPSLSLDAPWSIDQISKLPEIFVLAVAVQQQGSGMGSKLVNAALSDSRCQRVGCLVRTSNSRAAKFYLRNGFRLIGVERRGERTLELYFHESL